MPKRKTFLSSSKSNQYESACFSFSHFQLEVVIKLSTGSEYQLSLTLADAVVPAESKFEVLSTKVEVKLQKANASKWPTLDLKEGTEVCFISISSSWFNL
jgi:suppressor of G2 allele of SKP1